MKTTKEYLKLLKKVFVYLKPYKIQFWFVMTIMLVAMILSSLQPLFFGKIIDALTFQDFSYVLKMILIIGALGLFSLFLGIIKTYLNTKMSISLENSLKIKLFNNMLNMNVQKFDSIQKGEFIEKIESDVKVFSNILTSEIYSLIIDVGTIIFIGYLLFKINIFMTLFLIALFPISLIFNNFFGKKIKNKHQEFKTERDNYLSYFQEILNGFKTIKIFTSEKKVIEKYKNILSSLYVLNLKKTIFSTIGASISTIIGIFGNLGIILLGMYFILENNLTLGNLVAFNSYSAMFSSALFKISTLNIKIHKSIISLKRVFEFLEKHETKKVFENNENIEDKTFLFKENLLIHNLYFKYNHSCNIIENLNTKIEKKKINVIAGLSGCGKTTLVSIIMGLYDNYEGTIVLGNTDYKNISIENKFNNIVFVTQESFFFNGTIKENLLIESPEVTEDEIISVCQKVNIHDYINSLPQKYDSILGYSGTEFSAGQKQKLSLARALLRKREIYIFDEITSSVDSFSEKIILHTIKELSKTKTIILISHRKTTLSIADNYIYFKNINEKKFKKEVIVRE